METGQGWKNRIRVSGREKIHEVYGKSIEGAEPRVKVVIMMGEEEEWRWRGSRQ